MTALILEFRRRYNRRLAAARQAFERANQYYEWVLERFDARRPSSRLLFQHADRMRERTRERYLAELRP